MSLSARTAICSNQMPITPLRSRSPPKQSAQARWQSIILAEAPNFNNPSLDLTAGRFPGYTYTGFVDDIIIFYELATLPPNVLGSSGPTYLRVDGSFQPIAGTMQFSIDFFESGDITEEVILHEMAHALGFGTVSAGRVEEAETKPAVHHGIQRHEQ